MEKFSKAIKLPFILLIYFQYYQQYINRLLFLNSYHIVNLNSKNFISLILFIPSFHYLRIITRD